jgi:hypothetical protein
VDEFEVIQANITTKSINQLNLSIEININQNFSQQKNDFSTEENYFNIKSMFITQNLCEFLIEK